MSIIVWGRYTGRTIKKSKGTMSTAVRMVITSQVLRMKYIFLVLVQIKMFWLVCSLLTSEVVLVIVWSGRQKPEQAFPTGLTPLLICEKGRRKVRECHRSPLGSCQLFRIRILEEQQESSAGGHHRLEH